MNLPDVTVLYSAFVLGLAPDDSYKLFQCLMQRIAENSDAEFDDLRQVSIPVAVVTTKAFSEPKWGKNQPNLRGLCRQEVAENLLPQKYEVYLQLYDLFKTKNNRCLKIQDICYTYFITSNSSTSIMRAKEPPDCQLP